MLQLHYLVQYSKLLHAVGSTIIPTMYLKRLYFERLSTLKITELVMDQNVNPDCLAWRSQDLFHISLEVFSFLLFFNNICALLT